VEETNVDFEVGIPGSTKMVFSNDNTSAGTIVKLTGFDKDKYMQIDIDEFVSELEKHFEQLLNRRNLKVDVIYPNYKIHRCNPFKYDAYDGEIYHRTLTRLEYTACKKTSRKEIIDISKNPVIIFLKIIKAPDDVHGHQMDCRIIFFLVIKNHLSTVHTFSALPYKTRCM